MDNLDDELVAATDALLNRDKPVTLSGENRELGDVLLQLYRAIQPDQPPTAEFERRLSQRLGMEWERTHTSPLRRLDRPLVRVASMAAAVVVILGALLVLAVPDSAAQLEGTAIGLDDATAVLVLVGVIGVFVYWRNRR
jgi:hypothetical protein